MMMQNPTSSSLPASMSSSIPVKGTIQSSVKETSSKKMEATRSVGGTTTTTATTEWMKRRTLKRIQNEHKKDSARRASLAAADIVWQSCIERLSEQQLQGDGIGGNVGNSVTTSGHGASSPHSKNVRVSTGQQFSSQITSGRDRMPSNAMNHFTTIKRNLNNASNHSNTSTDFSATRALGFPSSPTLIVPNTRSQPRQQSGFPITIDYWSDNDEDNEEEKMEDFAREKYLQYDAKYLDPNVPSIHETGKSSTVFTSNAIKDDLLVPDRSYIENAAQRGWIRGELERNDGLEENDDLQEIYLSQTSTNAIKIDNNNKTVYTTTSIPLDNDEFDLHNQTTLSRSEVKHNYNRIKYPQQATERKWKLLPFFSSGRRASKKQQNRYSGKSSVVSVRASVHSNGYNSITRSKFRGKKRQANNNANISDAGTTKVEAWMCGVCGMAFSSKRTAAIHERQHIEEIVYELSVNIFEKNFRHGPNKSSIATVLANNLHTNANRRRNTTSSSSLNSERQVNDGKLDKQQGVRRAGRRPGKANGKLDEIIGNDFDESLGLEIQNVQNPGVETSNEQNKLNNEDLLKGEVNGEGWGDKRVRRNLAATSVKSNVSVGVEPDMYRIDDKMLAAIDVDATPLRSGSSIRPEDTYHRIYAGSRSASVVAASPTIHDTTMTNNHEKNDKQRRTQSPEQMPLSATLRNKNNVDSDSIGNGSRHVAFSDELDKSSSQNGILREQAYLEQTRQRSNSHSTLSDDAQSGTFDDTWTSNIRRRRGGRRGIISNSNYDPSVITNKNLIATIYEDYFPGLESDIPDLPQDALVPRIRARNNSESYPHDNDNRTTIKYYDDDGNRNCNSDNDLYYRSSVDHRDVLLLSSEMRNSVIRADEALVNVVSYAESLILNYTERRAEYELSLLAGDKRYYDEVAYRAVARRIDPSSKYRNNNENLLGKIQNKLLDAYQLMKDSDGKSRYSQDEYTRKRKVNPEDQVTAVPHNSSTLYVNVMVKNSVNVVQHELQRLAKQRWEATTNIAPNNKQDEGGKVANNTSKFELVYVYDNYLTVILSLYL
jgi:hypothetical protein